jgi:hypothetical protein
MDEESVVERRRASVVFQVYLSMGAAVKLVSWSLAMCLLSSAVCLYLK